MRIATKLRMQFAWGAALCASLITLSATLQASEAAPSSQPKASQLQLRAWVAEGLRNGWIQCEKPIIEVRERTLNWKISQPQGDLPGMVKSQVMVEAVRNAFPRPDQRTWWEPHLQRVERVVADELAYRSAKSPLDPEMLDAYQKLAGRLINEAGQAYAKSLGLEFHKIVSTPGPPAARALEPVTLITSPANSIILIIPKSKFMISKLTGEAPSFEAISSGNSTRLAGSYAYKIRRPDGSETEVKFFEVRQGGTYRLE